MSDSVKTSTTVSGRGLNKKTTVSTTTTDSNGNSFTRSTTSRSVGEKLSIGTNIFALIVGVLLVVSLVKSLIGSNSITFGGLLETLSSAPSVDMSMTSFEVIAPLQWGGILSALATFLNFFISIFNVIIFAFKGLSQVVIYLVYFVKFIFV